MKLSEAIRLGVMATKQGFGPSSFMSDTAPCALGAARLAVGVMGRPWECPTTLLGGRWPLLCEEIAFPLPTINLVIAKGEHTTVARVIWLMNDHYRLTREQIADWVATIEPADIPKEEAACVEVRSQK